MISFLESVIFHTINIYWTCVVIVTEDILWVVFVSCLLFRSSVCFNISSGDTKTNVSDAYIVDDRSSNVKCEMDGSECSFKCPYNMTTFNGSPVCFNKTVLRRPAEVLNGVPQCKYNFSQIDSRLCTYRSLNLGSTVHYRVRNLYGDTVVDETGWWHLCILSLFPLTSQLQIAHYSYVMPGTSWKWFVHWIMTTLTWKKCCNSST